MCVERNLIITSAPEVCLKRYCIGSIQQEDWNCLYLCPANRLGKHLRSNITRFTSIPWFENWSWPGWGQICVCQKRSTGVVGGQEKAKEVEQAQESKDTATTETAIALVPGESAKDVGTEDQSVEVDKKEENPK